MSRILILGLGASGKAAEALAHARGDATVALEGDAAFPDGAFDLAVVSPGIPLAHPWIAACRTRGIPVESELQYGCEACAARGMKLVAVTGSKGKSSVVKLVAEGLTLAGRPAVACGNYGRPASDVALAEGFAWAVVEVSSFQLETTHLPAGFFEAACVLNLQEDHLDRHGSIEAYHALKRGLLKMAKAGFGPEGTGKMPVPREGTGKMPVPREDTGKMPVPREHGQDARATVVAGSYFDNPVLAANGAMGAALMRAAGLDDAQIAAAFAAFRPLPHRMNAVGEVGGVVCIDDSKATSVAALAAGLRMAPGKGRNVRLIAGGLAKGDDPKIAVGDLTARGKKVYLIGRCAEAFSSAWSGAADCEICGTLERAVVNALRDAAKGDVLLLSPGTASFDQFKSYGERGDVFARLVTQEREKSKR